MRIALLGDIGIFGRFAQMSDEQFTEYYREYLNIIHDCDFVVGNLEVPFSKERKEFREKSACIFSDEKDIFKLKSLQLTHVNLANNHTGDYGEEGYDLTIDLLENLGIEYFGVANKQAFIEFGNSKIALSGYCNMD
ncbi:CapA family protein [Parahaliea sp. F7430]|uniref:CapA family protein n=1 Tax=Sediminihaliea albiluteola TaxID=2758564 RepID=A0A7W2TUT5_9GAMM|nr:CapA family protein [Sediminihaliea albiluteola]